MKQMENNHQTSKNPKLPEMFRSLMWSYKFEEIDPDVHYGELVVNTVNYGTLKHWRWLVDYFGKDRMKQILEERWETEFNRESLHLAQIIFGINQFRHVPRGAH